MDCESFCLVPFVLIKKEKIKNHKINRIKTNIVEWMCQGERREEWEENGYYLLQEPKENATLLP